MYPLQNQIKKLLANFVGSVEGRVGIVGLLDSNRSVKYVSTDSNIDQETQFDVASVTKTVATAYSALKLIELGKLNINDAIADIIPRFKYREVKVHHLLTMTLDLDLPPLSKTIFNNPEDLRRTIVSARLNAEPGSRYMYVNSTSILLGYVIEEITGLDLSEVVRDYVTEPLSLNNTHTAPEAPTSRVINTLDPNRFPHDETAHMLFEHGSFGGHAGLVSTADDLLKVLIDLIFDKKFFKPSTYKLMLEPQAESLDFVSSYGWEMYSPILDTTRLKGLVFKTGYTGCLIAARPESNRGLVILTNSTFPKGKDKILLSSLDQELLDMWLA